MNDSNQNSGLAILPPVLVTGVAGFIGFHTALRLISQGRRVVGVDNFSPYYDVQLKRDRLSYLKAEPAFRFVELNIADKLAMEKLWREEGPFVEVIHLAAQAGVRYSLINPYEYITTNCMGHLTVMEMCRHTPGFRHMVYASSSSVYGGNEKLPFSVKDDVSHPISLYAATKRSDELMSQSYSHLYNIPQTGLRFFTVYGPWGRPDMSLFIFTKAIVAGEKLPVFNHGQMKRDFTYVDDIVSGVVAALEHPPVREGRQAPHRLLNIGNTRSENLMDFIRLIEVELGRKANIEFMGMQPGDVPETFADITETTAVTGFRPTTTIAQGVPRFVAWYKDYYRVS
ncbi:MAG: NAD-dependent epimerase/dehydratase family protein [Micavibrio aeruginosavorus]|uniref:NAD-dependent epimerase/dehydratase family protein n=1 Tax=Micavibrio aeruginosavorus TaxID=349221 RepID=A0A7T5R2G9_9BACT|nr:MAG: NAD-dependent epimerase/dehydratase family protein [Micavibrio aeruginosavorus]